MKKVAAMLLLLLVLTILFIPATRAQGPSFAEGFDDVGPTEPGTDGPAKLITRGWIFRNQSEPRGSSSWYGSQGVQVLSPHSGTGMMAADFNSVAIYEPGAGISNWAIVPAVTGQQAGTPLSFAVAGSYTGRDDRLQVRYSPSGGTDTGSGMSDVGDFTQVLLDVNPVPTMGWEVFQLTLPGPGRVAFRYYMPPPLMPQWANFFAIDTLVIGTPPPAPIPIPGPGQSVTWGPDLSPIEVTGRLIIPEEGTVLVEAGVEIHLKPNSTLVIEGTVQGEGTETTPIEVTAAANFPPAVEVNGTLELTHAVVGGQLRPGSGSTLRFDQTLFQDHGQIFAEGWNFSEAAYLQVDNSHFERPLTTDLAIRITDSTVVLRDTAFHDANASVSSSHVHLDNLNFDGGRLSLDTNDQPDLINNVTVRNVPGAAIQLGGANDYFLGPALTLENNEYPVGVANGGILPGSSVPTTGNTHNAVRGPSDSEDYFGPVTWADAGVPYEITGWPFLWGRWSFLPGTTFKLGPGAGLEAEGPGPWIEARGEPGRPVTFTWLNPGQSWERLYGLERLEHAVVEGGQTALVSPGGLATHVDSTRFENNAQAIVNYSVVRSSQFINNGIALAGTSVNARGEQMPNSFEGNGLAAQGSLDATHNWWGSPTGPTTPENPGGTGDPIASGVPFQPFRTSPPDYSDSPPVVHLNEVSPILEPGSKTMLMWSATDDGTITGYRVLFSPAGAGPNHYTVLAELPPSRQAFAWTVPDIGIQLNGEPPSIRVEATDDQGQIGWDATYTTIAPVPIEGTLEMNPAPSGTYRAGEVFDVCWTVSGANMGAGSVDAFIWLDADHRVVSLGGAPALADCLALGLQMPFVHTEDARLVLYFHNYNGHKLVYSEPFTIEADPRVGDAPPSVTLVSPQAGQVFAPGQAVPITWQAADDEGLRSFEIQATFDGGRTWQVVAPDLPADARSYDWITAPNANLSDVRVRVVARDLRFQNVSDGAQRVFAIGGAPPTATATPIGSPGGDPSAAGTLHLPIVSR